VDFATHGAATNAAAVSLSSARARVSQRARGARSRVSERARTASFHLAVSERPQALHGSGNPADRQSRERSIDPVFKPRSLARHRARKQSVTRAVRSYSYSVPSSVLEDALRRDAGYDPRRAKLGHVDRQALEPRR